MKKSTKIWIGIATGAILLGTASALLGVFIPRLFEQQAINKLIENQVKPSEGKGDYLQYKLKTAVGESDGSLQSIEQVALEALANKSSFESIIDGSVSNYVAEFFKNFKGSDAYSERYTKWQEEIKEEWDNLLKNYKQAHGSTWQFYFQANILDPVGGNQDDWWREKLFEKVNSAFDEFLFQNLYVNATDPSGNVLKATTSPSSSIQKYLFSPEFVNGTTTGTRNRVKFQADATSINTTPYSTALAKFQEYVFDQYVKETIPIVTSMVLFKHVAPQVDGSSNFFNVAKAKTIYDSNNATDVVGTEASYTWQVFDNAQSSIDNPTGGTTLSATDKFINFVNKLGSDYSNNPLVFYNTDTAATNNLGGAINIPASLYTDDSATLYYVKLNTAYADSFPQYAAATNYKLNNALGYTDANVPTKRTISTTKLAGANGTEIMNNFFTSNTTATKGYFSLPSQVKEIVNSDASYSFNGRYNGVTEITDTINIKEASPGTVDTPFIMTRDEAGVHIIGIDRYYALKNATTYDGKINEIKNTIMWRYALGQFGMSNTTGFTLDLQNEIKTYFTANRNTLLYNYIVANEKETPELPANEYIFSTNFTDVTSLPKLATSYYHDYINKWVAYLAYQNKSEHRGNVKEKILGLQTTYTEKLYGNSVIQNGIAGVLPYTRNTTPNATPLEANNGVVDNVYGTYEALDLYQNLNAANATVAVNYYSNTKAEQMKIDIVDTIVPTLYNQINTNDKIGFKTLTYSSAKYNQYLLIGTSDSPKLSTNLYINTGDLLNNAVGQWISSDQTENIIQIEQLITDINYVGDDSVVDTQNGALASSYATPATPAPSTPTPTQASSQTEVTKYINMQLQSAFDVQKKLSIATKNMLNSVSFGASYQDILKIGREDWASDYLANKVYSLSNMSYFKEMAALKYAFDYNEDTKTYDFTKFRQYLIDQTSNNQKAAYAWSTYEKIDLFTNYNANSIFNNFQYKTNLVNKGVGAYGYAYQGAQSNFRNATTGAWNNTVTFNNKDNYFNIVNLSQGTSQAFTGFQGMQFENIISSELPSTARTDLFGDNLKVYNGYDVTNAAAGTPSNSNITLKGVLYNVGGATVNERRASFVDSIQNKIYTWSQVNRMANWFANTFNIDISTISKNNITDAKNGLMAIANDPTQIPNDIFERNVNQLLVNNSASVIQPNDGNKLPYYFDASDGFYSNIVFTQFNQYDVIELFDTNGDKIVDSLDKGINWTIANSASQFLGSSAQAFFVSAYQWSTNQSSYSSISYNAVTARQAKINVYDRRLNDQLGETLVANYKKNETK